MTTSGVFTEYRIPTASSQASGIVSGPDGNLWFTEANGTTGNKIGRITTAGVITEFPLPTANASPYNIVVGPDAALWFTESNSGASRIGRITTAGVRTEYPVPTSISAPFGIALGPDGNLWFTERAKSKLGQLTAAVAKNSYVLVLASGYVGKNITVAQGTKVNWVFEPGRNATVTDSSALALFNSASRRTGSSYAFSFTVAGTYAYRNALKTTQTGSVSVPLVITPASGTVSTTFTVKWASAAPPAGYVVDVQLRRPGTTTFVAWQTGQTTLSKPFVAGAGGAGTYAFRARLRKVSNGAFSGFSAIKTITVS